MTIAGYTFNLHSNISSLAEQYLVRYDTAIVAFTWNPTARTTAACAERAYWRWTTTARGSTTACPSTTTNTSSSSWAMRSCTASTSHSPVCSTLSYFGRYVSPLIIYFYLSVVLCLILVFFILLNGGTFIRGLAQLYW